MNKVPDMCKEFLLKHDEWREHFVVEARDTGAVFVCKYCRDTGTTASRGVLLPGTNPSYVLRRHYDSCKYRMKHDILHQEVHQSDRTAYQRKIADYERRVAGLQDDLAEERQRKEYASECAGTYMHKVCSLEQQRYVLERRAIAAEKAAVSLACVVQHLGDNQG